MVKDEEQGGYHKETSWYDAFTVDKSGNVTIQNSLSAYTLDVDYKLKTYSLEAEIIKFKGNYVTKNTKTVATSVVGKTGYGFFFSPSLKYVPSIDGYVFNTYPSFTQVGATAQIEAITFLRAGL